MKINLDQTFYDWTPLKARRNGLLQSTDKYLLPDFPCSAEDRAKVVLYRAELRALFEGKNSPDEVVFPEWPLD